MCYIYIESERSGSARAMLALDDRRSTTMMTNTSVHYGIASQTQRHTLRERSIKNDMFACVCVEELRRKLLWRRRKREREREREHV